jgi:hypothetical protein
MLCLSAIVVFLSSIDLVVNRRVWGPRWPELLRRLRGAAARSLRARYTTSTDVTNFTLVALVLGMRRGWHVNRMD